MIVELNPLARRLAHLVACLVLLLATGHVSAQAIDVFMRIDGLPGESVDARHPNEIVLSSYSQTFGTRNCSRVIAVKSIDRASPGLIARAAANTLIPQVVISMSRSGLGFDFFRATLNQVLIDRIELNQAFDQLQERVVLAPRTITISYVPINDRGQPGPAVTTTIACN